LEDLILQAEIFLQYGMRDKAHERLERIAQLFPGAEERNEELKALHRKTQFSTSGLAQSIATAGLPSTMDLGTHLKRVSEVNRNLSRQGTVKGVLSAAVNDIGRFWQVNRCVVGLATPNRPPSLAMEYIANVSASDAARLSKLVMGVQQANAGKSTPLVAENVLDSPQLFALQETLAALQVKSLLAIPLRDADQEIGVLILEQCEQKRR
jgi:hypothetical protein